MSFWRKKNRRNIIRSIYRSLRLVPSLVKNNPAAENTRSASTEVGGMVSRALFTAAMEVVCYLPTTNSCISLKYLYSRLKSSWTAGSRGLEVEQLYKSCHLRLNQMMGRQRKNGTGRRILTNEESLVKW